jgi:hypothetical protein
MKSPLSYLTYALALCKWRINDLLFRLKYNQFAGLSIKIELKKPPKIDSRLWAIQRLTNPHPSTSASIPRLDITDCKDDEDLESKQFVITQNMNAGE